MDEFELNSIQLNFQIFGSEYLNISNTILINYRFWIVELIYVYSICKEMILNEKKMIISQCIQARGYCHRWTSSFLISWSKILPWSTLEGNQLWLGERETDWRMVQVWYQTNRLILSFRSFYWLFRYLSKNSRFKFCVCSISN